MDLSEPAHPARVMARVLALLNPYFDKDTPQAIREIEAEDWAVALRDKPFWAIERAARWWKSEDNPDRRKRPLEGDIAARARRELDAVNAARLILEGKKMPAAEVQKQDRQSMSDDQRQQMRDRMAEVGNATLKAMRRNLEGLQ